MYENFYDDNYLLEERSTGVFNHMAFKHYIETIDDELEKPEQLLSKFIVPIKGRNLMLKVAFSKYNSAIKDIIEQISSLKKEKNLNKTKQSKLQTLTKRLQTYQNRVSIINQKQKNLKSDMKDAKEIMDNVNDTMQNAKDEIARLGKKFKETGDKQTDAIFQRKSLEYKEMSILFTLLKSFVNDDMGTYIDKFEKGNKQILDNLKDIRKQYIENLKTATGTKKVETLKGMKSLQFKYYRTVANLKKVDNIKKHFLQ